MTRIALIAHDDEKDEMIELAHEYESYLQSVELVCTGTTGGRIQDEVGLSVERKESGPQGGDLQIGSEVAEEDIDAVLFLRDPLTAQPHEPDITALLRICDVHDTPMATTHTAAGLLLDSLARQDGIDPHADG